MRDKAINRFKAILFDMDGVLFDSEPAYLRLNARLMEEAGYPVSQQALLACIGTSMEQTCQILKDDAGAPFSVQQMLDNFDQVSRARPLQYPDLVEPDAHTVLKALKDQGFVLGLASSSDRRAVDYALTASGLMAYLDCTISADDVRYKKPAPDCYLLAASHLGIAPAHCLVIEDTFVGVQAGKAAGMQVLGRVHQDYAQDLSQADALVGSLTEALSWVLG